MSSRKRHTTQATEELPPRIRRAYFECRFGQLHVLNAMPSGGGFDERTPLLCLHQTPMSGRVFESFLPLIGRDRSVFAPDTPGYGASDAPSEPPQIADYAAAMGDFLDSMRFRSIDVLGYHTGAVIATELALSRPTQIRRLVQVGVPLFSADERRAFMQAPWPVQIAEDGSHLTTEWQRSLRWRGPGVTLEMLADAFAQKLVNGPRARWAGQAVMQYPLQERLVAVRQPLLCLRPKDDLWEAGGRVPALLPQARCRDLPDYGFGLFTVAPQVIAEQVRAFLDG
ncbi:MAG: alpha/beta fold hydrolase [Steroidobacteraceae bacterium]